MNYPKYCPSSLLVCIILAGLLFFFPSSVGAQSLPCGTEVSPSYDVFWAPYQSNFERYQQSDWQSRTPDVIRVHFIQFTNSDGTGGLSRMELQSALDVVNIRFAPANMRFEMCEPSYIASAALADFQENTDEAEAFLYKKPKVLNVFVPDSVFTINNLSICGYAYFPDAPKEGVFISRHCMLNGSTLAHELGHYFNLFHTHGRTNFGTTDEKVDGSNCGEAGDLICDTPADPNLLTDMVDSSCLYIGTSTDVNGDPYQPDPRNIMSYAPKQCHDFFSVEQSARMRFAMEFLRLNLVLNDDQICADPSPSACLTVTSAEDFGPGTLRSAMACANRRPGPDTIRFQVNASSIKVDFALPPFMDDSTVLEGFNLQRNTPMVIDADQVAGDNGSLFRVMGNQIEIREIHIEEHVPASQYRFSQGAIHVMDGASDFLLQAIHINAAHTAVLLEDGTGRMVGCQLEGNRYGLRYKEGSSAIELSESSILCTEFSPIDFENASPDQVKDLPAPPVIAQVGGESISGTAIPGARVDLFENVTDACAGAPCQGKYLASTMANSEGFWEFQNLSQLVSTYTTTASVSQGGRVSSSNFSSCVSGQAAGSLSLYPVPVASAELFLEITDAPGTLEVQILDLLGKQVFTQVYEMNSSYLKQKLELGENFSAGVYIVRVQLADRLISRKITVQ
ncbi:MAG: zinc-dependent metalloprotease [Bacteroidota bacterium]